jgi:uncharacterized lipoprotein
VGRRKGAGSRWDDGVVSRVLIIALVLLTAGCSTDSSTSSSSYKDGYAYAGAQAYVATSAADAAKTCSYWADAYGIPQGDNLSQWESGCETNKSAYLAPLPALPPGPVPSPTKPPPPAYLDR